MMKILGFLGGMWSIFTTVFMLLFCCMEGTLELKAKPVWAIVIIYALGITSAFMAFQGGFPYVENKKAKRKSKRRK